MKEGVLTVTVEECTPGTAAIVRQSEREILNTAQGASTGLVIDANAAGGVASVLDISLATGADGAAPHFHKISAELFYVVSGRIDILAGDRITTLSAGDTALIPPLMHHAFAASPGHDAHLFTVIAPGVQRFDYFRLLDGIFTGKQPASELEAAPDFDTHFVDSAVWGDARGLTTRS